MQTDVSAETRTAEWIERRNSFVPRGVATYDPIVVDHAHGAEVWDVDGHRYIDFASGISTLNVGHTPAEIVGAIQRQAERLLHMCFSVSYYPQYIELAERLAGSVTWGGANKTLLVNSGAEAVENAIKIARAATGRSAVIAFENAFHGRTSMAMALTGKERPYKVGFGPLAPEVYHARYPYRYRCDCADPDTCTIESGEDLERLFATTVSPGSVDAIIVEPVQGEGGFIPAPTDWLRKVRQLCDREGILLIADEVQTGFGRTGRMWAMEHADVAPDLMVLAKSIAAGLPLAAVVGRAVVMDAPGPGGIGGTFGGNPLACVAALAVLDMFEAQDLVTRAQRIGQILEERFAAMATRYELIGEARGLGAMRAIELVSDRRSKEPAKHETSLVLERCLGRGLIVLKAGLYDNVVRVLAPLTIGDRLLNEGLDILEEVIGELSPRSA